MPAPKKHINRQVFGPKGRKIDSLGEKLVDTLVTTVTCEVHSILANEIQSKSRANFKYNSFEKANKAVNYPKEKG